MGDVLPFTYFARDNIADGDRIQFTAPELEAQMRDPYAKAPTKKGLPMVSPTHFRGDHRARVNIERVYMLGLDLDERQLDPEPYVTQIHEAMGRVRMFCYSTYSSTPEQGYKLRALIPYTQPAAWDVHERSWKYVEGKLARVGVIIDPQCKDAPRGYYIWSVPPSGFYWNLHIPGRTWDAQGAAVQQFKAEQADMARTTRQALRRDPASGDRVGRARAYLRKVPPAIQGAGGSADTITAALKVIGLLGLSEPEALDALDEWNASCSPPWPIEGKQGLRRKVTEAIRIGGRR
jgi:hypothetical protein